MPPRCVLLLSITPCWVRNCTMVVICSFAQLPNANIAFPRVNGYLKTTKRYWTFPQSHLSRTIRFSFPLSPSYLEIPLPASEWTHQFIFPPLKTLTTSNRRNMLSDNLLKQAMGSFLHSNEAAPRSPIGAFHQIMEETGQLSCQGVWSVWKWSWLPDSRQTGMLQINLDYWVNASNLKSYGSYPTWPSNLKPLNGSFLLSKCISWLN